MPPGCGPTERPGRTAPRDSRRRRRRRGCQPGEQVGEATARVGGEDAEQDEQGSVERGERPRHEWHRSRRTLSGVARWRGLTRSFRHSFPLTPVLTHARGPPRGRRCSRGRPPSRRRPARAVAEWPGEVVERALAVTGSDEQSVRTTDPPMRTPRGEFRGRSDPSARGPGGPSAPRLPTPVTTSPPTPPRTATQL